MFSSLRAEFLLIQQTGTVSQAVNDCFSCVHLCIASENQASKISVDIHRLFTIRDRRKHIRGDLLRICFATDFNTA